MNKIHTFRIIVVAFFSALFPLLLGSCVDDMSIDREFHEEQKLVLYSRLCPQLDTTYILLSNTQLMYSSSNQGALNPQNAVVELSADGNHWVRADYLLEKEHFFLTKEQFPIQEGGTYYIRATYPGYDDVSSSCTVPYAHDTGLRFDTVSAQGDVHLGEIYDWPHKDVYVEWRDVAGEENYYAVVLHWNMPTYYHEENGFSVLTHEWKYHVQYLYLNNADYRYVSDEGKDGNLMRYLITDNLTDEDIEGEEEDEEEEVEYYQFFLDRNCYLYEKTLNSDEFGLGFLLLEPLHTYTNIENGFGLFGAFSMRLVP